MSPGEGSKLARRTVARVRELRVRDVPSMRRVRRELSRALRDESPAVVRAAAELLIRNGLRWMGYELIHSHAATLTALTASDVQALGQGIASWDQVDTFSGYIAGPAWLHGQITDRVVAR